MKPLAMVFLAALPLLAGAPLHSMDVTTRDTVDFTGGTIHLATAYGQVNVESWDEPRVEVTVTRTAFRQKQKGTLERIQVKVTRARDGDVEVATVFPGRNWLLRTFHGLGDFNLDYRIRAPRNARLNVRDRVGDVVVYGIAGNIDAAVRTGDIVVQVPRPEKCAVDAKVGLGSVYSDLAADGADAQKLHLRVAVGGISVQ
jgi:hypothetical protein